MVWGACTKDRAKAAKGCAGVGVGWYCPTYTMGARGVTPENFGIFSSKYNFLMP